MSLASLMNTTINIQRKNPARDSSGGQIEQFADVPTLIGIPAQIQDKRGKAMRVLGQREVYLTHFVYLSQPYDIRRGDRVLQPSTGKVFLVHGFEDMAGQGRAWRIECSEQT